MQTQRLQNTSHITLTPADDAAIVAAMVAAAREIAAASDDQIAVVREDGAWHVVGAYTRDHLTAIWTAASMWADEHTHTWRVHDSVGSVRDAADGLGVWRAPQTGADVYVVTALSREDAARQLIDRHADTAHAPLLTALGAHRAWLVEIVHDDGRTERRVLSKPTPTLGRGNVESRVIRTVWGTDFADCVRRGER